jgi:hypothetical protein
LLEIKFGIKGVFLWDKPNLFPYPSGKLGDFEIGGKGRMDSRMEVLNHFG